MSKTNLFQGGVVRVPADDGDPHVLGQLEEVLASHRLPPVLLAVGDVDQGGYVLAQELLADLAQNFCWSWHWLEHLDKWLQLETFLKKLFLNILFIDLCLFEYSILGTIRHTDL